MPSIRLAYVPTALTIDWITFCFVLNETGETVYLTKTFNSKHVGI